MIYEKPKNEIFASDAKDGEIVEFPNIKRGWGVTENLGFIPPMEYFNAAFNRVDKSLAYQLQRGVGEWDKDLEYPIGAVVSLSGIIYVAKSQNTNKNPANEATIWSVSATQDWSDNKFTLKTDFANYKDAEGYTKLPNGLIIQWGKIGIPVGGRARVTYPIVFPNARLMLFIGSIIDAAPNSNGTGGYHRLRNFDNDRTGFDVAGMYGYTASYIAIGY